MTQTTNTMVQTKKIAYQVSFTSIIVNVFLTGFKLFAGIISNSSAMISDAIHSLSDVLSTFVVLIGIKVANKDADDTHPYGHEKLECIAAITLSIMLAITGFGIGYNALGLLIDYRNGIAIAIPGSFALIAALVSILTKEWMYWYTLAAAKKIDSGALKADAWHHRSDAMSSIGSFVGIGGAILGFPFCDPIASLIICILIVKVSVDILLDAIHKLTDHSLSNELVEEFKQLVLAQEGVLTIDDIRTRMFGSRYYIDIEISACKNLNLQEAHDISQQVHDALEEHYPKIKHCMVHVNPGDCNYTKET